MKEAAYGIVIRDDEPKTLLIRRRDTPVWVLPGGGIESDETPADACIRELKEETGLDVVITQKIAHYTPSNFLTAGVHIFRCRSIGGSLARGAETAEVGFYEPERVPGHLFKLHKRWIYDALSNSSQTLEGPITGASLIDAAWYLFCHPVISLRHLISRAGRPWNS